MSPKSFLFPAMATTMSSGPCSFSSFTHFFNVWKESWTKRTQQAEPWDGGCATTSSATASRRSTMCSSHKFPSTDQEGMQFAGHGGIMEVWCYKVMGKSLSITSSLNLFSAARGGAWGWQVRNECLMVGHLLFVDLKLDYPKYVFLSCLCC